MRIKTKHGGTEPFVWNKAQHYLHERLEDQLQRTGMVRALVLKGRQQGVSTYTAARYYQKVARKKDKSVFILSHHATTTETLFMIVDKYHVNAPSAAVPKLIVSNNRRMRFENGSQYTVGTAGSGSIGRGDTNHFFHGSEVAFYEKTDEISTGVLQTVADVPGTEIILESTANGMGNFFHQKCMDALSGDSRYELIFIPWYWQPEYRSWIPDNELATWAPTEEEARLMDMYKLDREQLQWRRLKIKDLGDKKFKQEYPFTVKEAFQSSGTSLIDLDAVAYARKQTFTDHIAPLVIGVDPARKGDRTTITYRKGRHWIKTDVFRNMDEMVLAGKLARIIEKQDPKKMFIDVAHGYGTIDRLHELGYEDIVQGVHFNEKPTEEHFLNKRAEMAINLRDWIESMEVRIPDEDEVEVDIGAIPDYKETSIGKIQLESKDKIKEQYGKSPDIFDSAMLTFAYTVRSDTTRRNRTFQTRNTKGGSPLHSRRDANRRRNARMEREGTDEELNQPENSRQLQQVQQQKKRGLQTRKRSNVAKLDNYTGEVTWNG